MLEDSAERSKDRKDSIADHLIAPFSNKLCLCHEQNIWRNHTSSANTFQIAIEVPGVIGVRQ